MTDRRQQVGENETPVRSQDKVMLRLPDGMRDRIKAKAEENNRSMNAEIVSRLERSDVVGAEAEYFYEAARALALAVEKVSNHPDHAPSILEMIARGIVELSDGLHMDREQVARDFAQAAERHLESAIHLSSELMDRIEVKAVKNSRSVRAEINKTLEREYPAPSDVMHIHLENIREALNRYERATDPHERLRLQNLVEMMASSGHGLEIDWLGEEE